MALLVLAPLKNRHALNVSRERTNLAFTTHLLKAHVPTATFRTVIGDTKINSALKFD